MSGLSPRVRGNLPRAAQWRGYLGSIPACAGEPRAARKRSLQRRVYPHVCGGTASTYTFGGGNSGLSPRVRGNRCKPAPPPSGRGSIPACAGEPVGRLLFRVAHGVYPRVCGGTNHHSSYRHPNGGLSPRVRGNLLVMRAVPSIRGSIPACAGEPPSCSSRHDRQRVYPRVCGGTLGALVADELIEGLSPRVRGNHYSPSLNSSSFGSIPACAGEPGTQPRLRATRRVYPRVCGGTRSGGPSLHRSGGSIPACAGEPRLTQQKN